MMNIFEDPTAYFDRMDFARKVIEKHGAATARKVMKLLEKGVKELSVLPPGDARLSENDIEKMKNSVDALYLTLADHDRKEFLSPGIEAIAQVKKTKEERSSGGANSHGMTQEERKQRNDQLQPEIERLCHAGKTYSSAKIIVGRKFELHPRTVGKYTKNPAK